MAVKTITIEITTDNTIYQLAQEFSAANNDFSMFDSPEKVLAEALMWKMNNIPDTLRTLSAIAERNRTEKRKEGRT